MVKCFACSKRIANKKDRIVSNENKWHKWCFVCQKCGLSYFKNKDQFEYIESDAGKIFIHIDCKNPICGVCNNIIGTLKSEKLIGHQDKYHTNCLKLYRTVTQSDYKYDLCDDCPRIRYNFDLLWPTLWLPTNHKNFPREFRQSVFTFLLVMKRMNNIIKMSIPKDIKVYIIQMLNQPCAWPIWNSINPNKLCTITRCQINCKCDKCDNLIRQVAHDNSTCLIDKCLFYRYSCRKCKKKIYHNDPHESVCTKYRCIDDRCRKCDGILRCCPNHQENLCSKTKCNLFSSRRCKCNNYILNNPIDVHSCTIYRCKNDRCRICGSCIKMKIDDNDYCSIDKCMISNDNMKNCFNEICNILNIEHDFFGDRTLKQKLVMLKSSIFANMKDISETDMTKITQLLSLI